MARKEPFIAREVLIFYKNWDRILIFLFQSILLREIRGKIHVNTNTGIR